jgi:hypothetical protein
MGMCKTLFFLLLHTVCSSFCFKNQSFPLCLKLKNCLPPFLFLFHFSSSLVASHALCVTCLLPTYCQQKQGLSPLFLWPGLVPHVGGTTQQISPSRLGGGLHQACFLSANFKLLHRQRFCHHI